MGCATSQIQLSLTLQACFNTRASAAVWKRTMIKKVLPLVVLGIVTASLGLAEDKRDTSKAESPDLKSFSSEEKIRKLQESLVWTSLYEGPIDGKLGPGTISAIKRFQKQLGEEATGTPKNSIIGKLGEMETKQIR